MTREYIAPDLTAVELELCDTILYSYPVPTESGNEMPILTKRIVRDELSGDPGLDPENLLEEPTDF